MRNGQEIEEWELVSRVFVSFDLMLLIFTRQTRHITNSFYWYTSLLQTITISMGGSALKNHISEIFFRSNNKAHSHFSHLISSLGLRHNSTGPIWIMIKTTPHLHSRWCSSCSRRGRGRREVRRPVIFVVQLQANIRNNNKIKKFKSANNY